MTTQPEELLAFAKSSEEIALKAFEDASDAVGNAETELAALRAELSNAELAERKAAENGEPTAKHTARIRDLQDSIRVKGYRLDRLKADAEKASAEYARAFAETQAAEQSVAHKKLREVAEKFEAALDAAADAKREYLAALHEFAEHVNAGRKDKSGTFRQDNINRVILWAVTTRLLEREQYAGKTLGGGVAILSAADIRQQIGEQFSPLIK